MGPEKAVKMKILRQLDATLTGGEFTEDRLRHRHGHLHRLGSYCLHEEELPEVPNQGRIANNERRVRGQVLKARTEKNGAILCKPKYKSLRS